MKRLTAVLALACLWLLPTTRVRADPLDTPLPKPAWEHTVGTLLVQKYGQGNPAIVFVPGLACGPWSWRDAVAHEAPHHTVYTVTLPGFDGLPAGDHATLDDAEASLVTLIQTEHLVKPVVVGHSLGGTLALRFGIDHGDLVRGIVTVDGTPVPPQLASDTPDQIKQSAQQFHDMIVAQSATEYDNGESRFTADFVTDQTLAAKVSTLVLRSDQKAVASYGEQLYLVDLRPQLSRLTVPTALIAPIPGLPLPSYLPPEMAGMSMDARESAALGFYKRLFNGIPNMTYLPVDNSLHFVMLDQPVLFEESLDKFIDGLP